MKIELLVQRDSGSTVELWGTEYKFVPQPDGCHVAEVLNEAHQDRFLSITDGYRIYRGGKKAAAEQKPKIDKEVVLVGSSVHPASFEINGKTYTLGDVVMAAHARSSLSEELWNTLSDNDREDRIDAELDHIAAATGVLAGIGDAPAVDPVAERAALVVEYEAVFGKQPHYKAGIEKIKAELAAAKV